MNNSNTQSPFDDPNATQPLPSRGSGRLGGAQAHSPANAPANTGSVLGGLQSGTASPVAAPPNRPSVNVPTGAQTGHLRLLPTPTLIGLAAAGAALAVVLIPALMRRMMPTVPMKQFPAETTARDTIAPPVVAKKPMRDPQTEGAVPSGAVPSGAVPSGAATDANTTATSQLPAEPSDAPTVVVVPEDEKAVEEKSPDVDVARADNAGGRDSDGSNGNNKGERVAASDQTPTRRNSDDTPRQSTSGGAYVHPRTGYEISPPANFKLRSSGRRTIWRGPNGAQLLVETTGAPGSSARADWERLDGALAKKYGRRYRSHGIRETTLAGRAAAVWEFEIESKRGTTRKIDVAVHAGGRGYAVLAEAPASRFDDLRPQLEAAIESFHLPSNSNGNESKRTDETEANARDEERRSTPEDNTEFSEPGY